MALIVLKNSELIVGYSAVGTGTSMPQAYEFDGLDVVAYGREHFAHIICDAQYSDTHHMLSRMRIMSIIDIFDRVPIADGQYIHCARDYFDKFDLTYNYIFGKQYWCEVPGSVREIVGETSEQKCVGCGNMSPWKIRIVGSDNYRCLICARMRDHSGIFDLYEQELGHYHPCWLWFIKQVLYWHDVRLVVTNIDIQTILLVGDDYYVTSAPIPPVAIDAIVGSRKRLRFAHNYYSLMMTGSPNANKKMIREIFRDCEIPKELRAH